MNDECPRGTYTSFGKKYSGEKAVISLTSWKARITTVPKTLFSLLKQCPGFHIVLVLSEEEFPRMMGELPPDLILFVENELIELLWVYKNYKSFKKILFTMDKYRDVPIISADDDCIYTCNYAQEMYNAWDVNKDCIITMHACPVTHFQHGAATLYCPHAFCDLGIKFLADATILKTNHDDVYYGCLAETMGIKIIDIWSNVPRSKTPYFFHDDMEALSRGPTAYDTNSATDIVRQQIKQDIQELL